MSEMYTIALLFGPASEMEIYTDTCLPDDVIVEIEDLTGHFGLFSSSFKKDDFIAMCKKALEHLESE